MNEQQNDPLADKDYEAYKQEETAYYNQLDELARNSGWYVECDEEIFPLNDDGSAKKDKGKKSGDLEIF